MRILVFGSLNLDHVYRVPCVVKVGETVPVTDYTVKLGGKGMNQATALSRAGLQLDFAGSVGEDGGRLREFLRGVGVDVTRLTTVPRPSGQAHIQVGPGGANAILLYAGANRTLTPERVEGTLADYGEGDLLVLQNEVNLLSEIIDRAYEKGMRIVLNSSPVTEELFSIDPAKLFLVFVNETEAAAFCRGEAAETVKARYRALYPDLNVVVTLGADGSLYFGPKGECRQAAYPAEAVDTTCAGDTFTGYFTEAFLRTGDPAYALARASAASAVAVSRVGAAETIPAAEEIRSEK